MKQLTTLVIMVLIGLQACQPSSHTNQNSTATTVKPSVFNAAPFAAPRPAQQPKTLVSASGDQRTDEYYWLNERENPAVTAYLESENRYADSVLAPVAGLREQLFEELKGRIQEDDASVPYFKNGYWYVVRFETGKEYPIYTRKKGDLNAAEEILLNVNDLAAGKAYCQVGGLTISPDNQLLAYGVDYTGRNLFQLYFKDLTTNTLLPDNFDYAGSAEWANDSKTIIYDTKDKVTLRNDKIWRHEVGSTKKDVLMYHEKDETQYAFLSKTKSEQYILINCAYTQTVEVHYLNADQPTGQFKVIRPREKDFFYEVSHRDDQFLIKTNWDAPNFRLMAAPVSDPRRDNWKDVLPHRDDVLLEGLTVFKDHLVAAERKGGLNQIHIMLWADLNKGHYIETGEPTYACFIDNNPEYNTKTLRYNFASLKTPATVIDYDMDTRQKTVKKVAPVLGGFDPNHYETEYVWVTARDGAKVPMSLVYKKGFTKNGSAPCHLTGYGSYGSSYDPFFNRDKISLLDRGFVVGIAHIRGGMEMGYKWYEDGKMLKKMNTFHDFVDCSEFLIKEKYTSADRFFAEGRSAGGLLMGAVTNMRPDLYKGIITGVPFVDVITTMSDASIPLTTGEYSEWGNPAIKEQYDYMKQYSPYDNLKKGDYPNMLVLTSFSDSQVQYFEPAKYVARVRDLKTDHNLLLFRTNMTGSHGGSSGRFERLKERALEYAWMMGLLGMDGQVLKQ